MSDAIVIEGLSKRYKLFRSKAAKIADLFGITLNGSHEEFWALRDVTLRVGRGEKVGLIGRNGAGKTTLLGVIAGNSAPTSGSVRVNGKVNALFTLGTGFHPEFTGRENIVSSLAFQGVTGKEARRLSEEIIEFAELEGFIEQPVKTYSAGMYARLAFTVATAVRPEIIIIDEILGAGDAYFASKAVERMKELTGEGTTVLFVSHDLASVQKMCDRVIWIDRGKIVAEGESLSVIKEYSADVRRREEQRLKAKNTRVSSGSALKEIDEGRLIVRFTTKSGRPPEGWLPVHRIAMLEGGERLCEILVGDSMDNSPGEEAHILTDKGLTNWGDPYKLEGRWVRDFKNAGGRDIHAPALFKPPSLGREVFFEIEHGPVNGENVLFETFDGNAYVTLGEIRPGCDKGWETARFVFKRESRPAPSEENDSPAEDPADTDVYGTWEARITRFEILDGEEREKYVFTVNEKLIFRIHYRTSSTVKRPIFVVAVYSKAGDCISQIISEDRGFTVEELGEEGHVDFILPSLRIGSGEFVVSVAIFHRMDTSVYVEQKAYDLHDRKYFFKIQQPFNVNINMGIVCQDAAFFHRVARHDGLLRAK